MRSVKIALMALAAGGLIAGSNPALAKSGNAVSTAGQKGNVRAGTKVAKSEKGDASSLPFVLGGIAAITTVILVANKNSPSSP
ncbi:hypothetical protein [Novosphingobium sp.]|uniref:hypothetical protein n=1 Tax=Novosphingobium sp. TaxID=1874826 RepID=UPI0035B2DC4B